jgi:hypothetical protein
MYIVLEIIEKKRFIRWFRPENGINVDVGFVPSKYLPYYTQGDFIIVQIFSGLIWSIAFQMCSGNSSFSHGFGAVG